MRLPFRSLLHTTTSSCCCKNPSMELLSSSGAATAVGAAPNIRRQRRREKVVVIMGPTGSGKSRLSVDLATRFSGEIINSDKIQVYKGLNITTNKIPLEERLGIPHHLLGEIDSSLGEFSPSQYRSRASSAISEIVSRRRVPFLVGGSNSFIHALLSEKFTGGDEEQQTPAVVSRELRYRCCFLWIDVSPAILNEYLRKRVDEMIEAGMIDELEKYYEYEINESEANTGLRKAIGVPEFERYFRERGDDTVRRGVYEEAVRAIKENTCQLAKAQVEKILRLKGEGGWGLQRLDATESFRGVLEGRKGWSDIWERQVVEPSVKIVKRFLAE